MWFNYTTGNRCIPDVVRRRVLYPMASGKSLSTSKPLSGRLLGVLSQESHSLRSNRTASGMTYSWRFHCWCPTFVDNGVLPTRCLGVGNTFPDVLERALGKRLISEAFTAPRDIIILIFNYFIHFFKSGVLFFVLIGYKFNKIERHQAQN